MSGVYLVLRVFYYEELGKKHGKYISDYLKTKTKHIRDLLENSSLDINSFDETFDLNSNHKTARRRSMDRRRNERILDGIGWKLCGRKFVGEP